ncbi:MAG: DMT family transporter [Pseudomonadota bacterium]
MTSNIEVVGEHARAQRMAAIALMCLAIFFFSLLDANVKWLTATFATAQIVFMRFLVHWLLTFVMVPPTRLPELWRTKRLGLQLLRASLLVATTTFNFLAVRYLQLSETVSIFFAGPLIVALLAGPILGEWVGPRRLIAILIGFCGVLVVMRPGLGGLPWQVIYSVGAVSTYALLAIVTRIIAPTEHSHTAHFYTGLLGSALFLPLAWQSWITPPDMITAAFLCTTGLFGLIGHQFMIAGHARAPAPVLAPFTYTGLLWMTAFGFMLFGDIPTLWTMLGASIVIASGLYLLFRERGLI